MGAPPTSCRAVICPRSLTVSNLYTLLVVNEFHAWQTGSLGWFYTQLHLYLHLQLHLQVLLQMTRLRFQFGGLKHNIVDRILLNISFNTSMDDRLSLFRRSLSELGSSMRIH